jgi:hypothetical protein
VPGKAENTQLLRDEPRRHTPIHAGPDTTAKFTPQIHDKVQPRDDMKKTLVLSMMLCGSVSLMLAGCGDEKGSTETTTSTTAATGDGDGDAETGGEGDGDASTTAPNTSGGLFIDEDLAGAVSECDPFLQDCHDGEKCVPYGSTGGNWDANKCVPILGDGAAGDTCTYTNITDATDSCDADTHCWDVMNVDGELIGICTEFCKGSPDNPQCGPGTSCLIANDGSINLCITTCDPLLQDCGTGLACFWANGAFNCIFTTQDIPVGEACGFINDCQAGNICLSADAIPNCNGSACCGAYCDLTEPFCEQAQTECVSFFEEGQAIPGYEDVGVCVLPG